MTPNQHQHLKELIDSLRSGKYKQTIGRLRDEDRYCCLGVACDLSRLSQWVTIADLFFYDGDCKRLSLNVQDHYGFLNPYGRISDRTTLSKLNDTGSTFEEIASIIEQEIK